MASIVYIHVVTVYLHQTVFLENMLSFEGLLISLCIHFLSHFGCFEMQTACWSPDGSVIVFAVAEEPALYSLKFHNHIAGIKANIIIIISRAYLQV
jgi:hypothetical protein